jgi:hypothetical protein
LGLQDFSDKESWNNVKPCILSRLNRPPFWPGPSKELITTIQNAAASAHWEEVIYYYGKDTVHDLFVGMESQFTGKGFEMIDYIDKYFNPTGHVDALAHIFELLDIKQGKQESVVTLRARFSKLFTSLSNGSTVINTGTCPGHASNSD